MIELRHLCSLAALRETGNVTLAAERLHLTQSALSHQLKDLEQRLGVRLFERKSRPLRFSVAGERLLALADQVLPAVRAVEYELARLRGGQAGRLHIAVECHSCFQWLLPAMERYRERWPEVEMDLTLGHSFHPLPALVRGEIDLVITSDPAAELSGIHYDALFRHQMLLAMHAGSPLAQRKWIEPEDLAGETLITYPVCRSRLDVFTRFLEPAGVEPASVRTSELTVMIVQLVASRRGVTVLPDWALAEYLGRGQIVTRPLGPNGLWSTLYAAVRAEERSVPFMEAFIRMACQVSAEVLRDMRPAPVEAAARSRALRRPGGAAR